MIFILQRYRKWFGVCCSLALCVCCVARFYFGVIFISWLLELGYMLLNARSFWFCGFIGF